MPLPFAVAAPASAPAQAAGPKPQGLATASLVLGIISCTLVLNWCFIPSVLAIVFGTMALGRVREGTGGGESMARAGRICGIISLIVTFLLTLLWVLGFVLFTARPHHVVM